MVRLLAPGREGGQLLGQGRRMCLFVGAAGSLLAACRQAGPFWKVLSWSLGPSQAGLVQGIDCAAWGWVGGELEPGERLEAAGLRACQRQLHTGSCCEVSAPPSKSLVTVRLLSSVGYSPLQAGSHEKGKQ